MTACLLRAVCRRLTRRGTQNRMNQESVSQDTASRLKQSGIRPSVQRMAIYDYVASHPVHPTAETVYAALHPSLPTLSRTTVYNTLRQLSDKGIIQTVIIDEGELRYDAETRSHIHFKCTACKRIFDIFPGVRVPKSALPEGFVSVKTQTNVWGLCKDCADRARAESAAES